MKLFLDSFLYPIFNLQKLLLNLGFYLNKSVATHVIRGPYLINELLLVLKIFKHALSNDLRKLCFDEAINKHAYSTWIVIVGLRRS